MLSLPPSLPPAHSQQGHEIDDFVRSIEEEWKRLQILKSPWDGDYLGVGGVVVRVGG